MKIVDVISQKGKPILSFEIIPPNRGGSILDIYNRQCDETKVIAVKY